MKHLHCVQCVVSLFHIVWYCVGLSCIVGKCTTLYYCVLHSYTLFQPFPPTPLSHVAIANTVISLTVWLSNLISVMMPFWYRIQVSSGAHVWYIEVVLAEMTSVWLQAGDFPLLALGNLYAGTARVTAGWDRRADCHTYFRNVAILLAAGKLDTTS